MPLPPTALTISGGCNCRAIRYRMTIPPLPSRPLHPSTPSSSPYAVRLPFICTDHCNDCRRATASILPSWICAPMSIISASLVFRSKATLPDDASKRQPDAAPEERGPWLPAATVFAPGPESADSVLSFYESSPGRRRSFCARCGTNLAYAAVAEVPPGWPLMMDVVLGSVDRGDLDGAALEPERQLWWDCGISWVQRLSLQGVGGLPRHSRYKVDEVVG